MNKLLKTFAFAGILIFWLAILITSFLHPEYSHLTQYISELGAKKAPFAFIINYFGVFPFGCSIVMLGIFLWKNLAILPLGKLGYFLLLVTGLLFIIVSLYHCDEGCGFENMSQEAIIHNLAAMVAFLLAAVAILWIGVFLLFTKKNQNLAFISVLLGMLAVCCFYIIAKTGIYAEWRGLYQRLFLLTISSWFLIISWKVQPKNS